MSRRNVCDSLIKRPLLWSRICLLIISCAVFALSPLAVAQNLATVDGVVYDASGAVVPNVTAQLSNQTTGDTRTTKTNGVGVFSFPSLPAGNYILRLEAKGFQTHEVTDIHLNPGDQRSFKNLSLSLGVTESVTVTSDAGQINTDSGETSSLISSSDIEHLAVQGRDVTELLKILPGMSVVTSTTTFNNAPNDPSLVSFAGIMGSYSANGTQKNATSLLTDGMDITDPGSYGITIQNVNYDQVAEVKVQTGSFTADTAGGPVVINSITKSGNKNFHGSLYTYARTNQLNSMDWMAKYTQQPAPKDRQMYPGFTISGPVVFPGLVFNRNKKLTFFFGAEEYAQRNVYAYNNVSSATLNALVPTEGMHKGDFSATEIAKMLGPSYKPTTVNGSCSGVYGNICAVPTAGPHNETIANGNISSYIDPLSALIIKAYPLPNQASNGTYNYVVTDFVNSNLFQARARADYALSDATKIFVTYGIESGKQYQPSNTYNRGYANGMGGGMDTPGGGFVGTVRSHVASLNITSVLSPTTTNSIYVGGAYFSQPFSLKTPSAVTGNPYQFLYNNGSLAIPNVVTWGGHTLPFLNIEDPTWGPSFTKKQLRMAGDDFTKVLGRHTLRSGLFYQWVGNPQLGAGQNTNGEVNDYYHPSSFVDVDGSTTLYNSGNYLADFMYGHVNGISQANKRVETNLYFWSLAGYVQDHWLVNRKLSIDAGVRLMHMIPWSDPHGVGMAVFDPQAYAAGTPSTMPGVLWHAIDSRIPVSGVTTAAIFPMPRVGAAWDIHGNGSTVLRGGFGIYRQHDSYNDIADRGKTAAGRVTYSPSNGGFNFSTVHLLQGTSPTAFKSDISISTLLKSDTEIPLVRTYNLNLDQRLSKHTVFELGYIGNVGSHLMEGGDQQNINALPMGSLYGPQPNAGRTDTAATVGTYFPFFTPAAGGSNNSLSNLDTAHVDSYRKYPLYQNISAPRHLGYSNYNGMQVLFGYQRANVHISANYTFSKSLGAVSGSDPINIDNDYRLLNIDRRHIFNVNYYYSVGNLVHKRFLAAAVNGWSISGYAGYQAGTNLPSLMSSNFDASGTINVPVGTTANHGQNSSTCQTTSGTGTCGFAANTTMILGTPNYKLQPTVTGDPRGKASHQYIDSSVFHLPKLGQNGPWNIGPVTGPGYFNTDMSMGKNFRIGEGQNLNFSASAFNLINHANYTFSNLYPGSYQMSFAQTVGTVGDMDTILPNATQQQAMFGITKIRTGRRVMSLSMKYTF